MKIIEFGIIAILSITVSGFGNLDENFQTPPDSAKPQTWWHWMSGNVSKEGITADLEAMKRVGLGGFQAFHVSVFTPIGPIPVKEDLTAGPVDYMSDTWHEMMRHTIKEADRLDLEMCFHNCSGWSSSGGTWITPEYSMKEVVWSEKVVEGPLDFNALIEQPKTISGFYRDIVIVAFPTPAGEQAGEVFRISDWKARAGYARVMNLKPDDRKALAENTIEKRDIRILSDKMDNLGNLKWHFPAGKWTIIRFGYTSTGMTNRPSPPESRGLECDKLSKAAAQLHWDNTVQKVIDDAGDKAGKVFDNVLIDSYEVCTQNWTDGFDKEFGQRMGYDLIKYMPALTGRIVDSVEITDRFLWDFRRVIADLFTENYFGYFADMCHRNGLKLSIEPYTYTNWGGNFDEFAASSKADIPMGEWWAQVGRQWHHSSAKLASSAAHTNGRKFVGAEAFTAAGLSCFINHPYVLKSQGDYFYCKGVNRFIFHTFVHQPWMNVYPGMTMGPYGFQFNRNNTWFEKSTAWIQYLSRCQYLLQEGTFQADICYFMGENPSSDAPVREDIVPAVPYGYDYDLCGAETFYNMTVENGSIKLPDGMKYSLLVLPQGNMRPEILRKVKDLVDAGALVYGELPARSPSLADYPRCDREVKRLADYYWKSGKIISEKPLDQLLRSKNILPDFDFTGDAPNGPLRYPGKGVEYIHRNVEGVDIYFVSNQNEQTKSINAVFRVTGKQPELWDPLTGQIGDVPCYSFTEDGRTSVPLVLGPADSVFVVFREPIRKKRIEDVVFSETRDLTNDKKFRIVKAVYGVLSGVPTQKIDITEKLQKLIENGNSSVMVDNNIAGDPAYKTPKQLRVEYVLDGKQHSETINEKQIWMFPQVYPKEGVVFKAMYQDNDIVLSGLKTGTYEIRKDDGSREMVEVKVAAPLEIDGSWTLQFPAGWGAPPQIQINELIDWTTHKNYDIKHFSGTATYLKDFEMPADEINKGEPLFLDLGVVNIMAEVKLNGKDLGILWKPPFRVDVGDVIKVGANHLEIEVTNLWPNRLIGDEKYPVDYELKHSDAKGGRYVVKYPDWLVQGKDMPDTGRKTFVTWNYYSGNSPLLPSGLVGPVRLIRGKNIIIE